MGDGQFREGDARPEPRTAGPTQTASSGRRRRPLRRSWQVPLTVSRSAAGRAGAVVRAQAPVRAIAGARWNRGPTVTAWLAAARPGRGSSRLLPATARSFWSSSRVELQHGVGVAPEDLAGASSASEVMLPADDERPMSAHVKNRDYGTAAQGVALAYLGDAFHASPARPHFEDPASAGECPGLELNSASQVAIGVLEDRRVVRDSGDEERGHACFDSRSRAGRFVGTGRGGYRRRSASVICRITSEPLWTCSRTSSSFAARFSSAFSRVVFTRSPDEGRD